MTVKVASRPVRVTKLVHTSGSERSPSIEEGAEAATGLTEGTGMVTPSLVSVSPGEPAPSVVVMDTACPLELDVDSAAPNVDVIITPEDEEELVEASIVEKGVGPRRV